MICIIRADARRIPLRDDSVDLVVTSPPYWGLRKYEAEGQIGLEATPEEYVAQLVTVFREVLRVLKPSGSAYLNLGDCYATGAGRVGDRPGGGPQGDRWRGEGSKADLRKFATNTVDPKCRHGIGPMTQPNRMPLPGLKPKDMVGIPWRVAFALQADGWWLREDIIWAKPNPMPESVKDRCTRAHEYLFHLTKSERYFYDAEAIVEPFSEGTFKRIGQPNLLNQPGGEKDYAKTGAGQTSIRRTLENLAKKIDPHHGATRADRGFDTRDEVPGIRSHKKRESEAFREPSNGDPPHAGLEGARQAYRARNKTAENPPCRRSPAGAGAWRAERLRQERTQRALGVVVPLAAVPGRAFRHLPRGAAAPLHPGGLASRRRRPGPVRRLRHGGPRRGSARAVGDHARPRLPGPGPRSCALRPDGAAVSLMPSTSPIRICACPEEPADSEDFADDDASTPTNAHTHEGCRVFHKGMTCTINQEEERAVTKDKEKAAEALGFRVSRVTVKETDEGGKTGDATVIGVGFTQGSALIQAIGGGVELRSNGGDRRQKAILRSITFKAGKDGKPGTTTLKVTGAAELDDAIGSAVKVMPLQMNLPG